MYLKRLTMKGFKSFADTTALDFEPGVTVVVGPNGSGKSNVVDAIGWVLGAQAPSAVRSQKMDDVIFAGTTKRAALGRADLTADQIEEVRDLITATGAVKVVEDLIDGLLSNALTAANSAEIAPSARELLVELATSAIRRSH